MKTPRILLIGAIAAALAAGLWAALPGASATSSLAADLPPGALLTIESSDFSALLHSWNASPEGAAWMKSANYSAYSNSRLFSRLGDAQGEFEGVAGGSGLGSAFLRQVAGKESVFAWYDISKLEFLYITRLPAGRAANIELLQQRGKFSRRESGGVAFYVKTSAAVADAQDGPSTARTIAFATSGDWLLLATREDLMANALLLMQHPAGAGSLATEGWYSATEAAGPSRHGELHMLLDLQRITATPAFRTYWIQRNVSETRQYRSAVVDLYREGNVFREERSLLPATALPDETSQPDLAILESMVPERAGVYRVEASPTAQIALASLDEKVLSRSSNTVAETSASPAADLSIPHVGSGSDLETRIDTVAPAAEPASAASAPLLGLLQAAETDAMLTLDRTDSKQDGLFVPIHSAVVLHSLRAWDRAKLQDALLASLRARLTVSYLGLAWMPVSGTSYMSLGSAHPLVLYVDGGTVVLANDAGLLSDVLTKHGASAAQQHASLIAGFRHGQEHAPFLKLTSALALANNARGPENGDSVHAPDFFHDSVGSLSGAFESLASERLIERRDGAFVHQTVTYTWQAK